MRLSDSSLPHALPRRQLAALAASAVAAPVAARLLGGGAATAAPATLAPGSRLQLRPDPGSVVSALDVPLSGSSAPVSMRPVPGAVRTPVMETTRFTLLGVTWRSGRATVRARVRRTDGTWTAWRRLEKLHDGPDPSTAEGRRTPRATAATWLGPADAVQLELAGSPEDPVLALVDGGRAETDATAPAELLRSTVTRARRAPAPRMRSPRVWGANPKLRDGTSHLNKTLKQVHVHHTASSNDYSRADVPAIIRSMYRYHTRSLGWSDIGYNFLVDRFGRIWVGRKGSARHLVRGAHTLGFNHASMGIAVIGNFEAHRPTDRALSAIVRLAAWRLDWYDRDPRGTITVRSHGSDRFAAGRHVTLPVIDGHRDTNETACPGKYLYAELPGIRLRTARRIRRHKVVRRPER